MADFENEKNDITFLDEHPHPCILIQTSGRNQSWVVNLNKKILSLDLKQDHAYIFRVIKKTGSIDVLKNIFKIIILF